MKKVKLNDFLYIYIYKWKIKIVYLGLKINEKIRLKRILIDTRKFKIK